MPSLWEMLGGLGLRGGDPAAATRGGGGPARGRGGKLLDFLLADLVGDRGASGGGETGAGPDLGPSRARADGAQLSLMGGTPEAMERLTRPRPAARGRKRGMGRTLLGLLEGFNMSDGRDGGGYGSGSAPGGGIF